MLTEWLRLALGLIIIVFHRPIADWILIREHQLADQLNRRGWRLPTFPNTETAHTVYFCFGAVLCVFALTRIYFLM